MKTALCLLALLVLTAASAAEDLLADLQTIVELNYFYLRKQNYNPFL